MTEQGKKLLKELPQSLYGKALQEFLDEEYDIINNVQSCKTIEELKGRQLALETLEKLFSFMKEIKIEIKNKNQYE